MAQVEVFRSAEEIGQEVAFLRRLAGVQVEETYEYPLEEVKEKVARELDLQRQMAGYVCRECSFPTANRTIIYENTPDGVGIEVARISICDGCEE